MDDVYGYRHEDCVVETGRQRDYQFAVPFASVVMGRMSPGQIGAHESDLMETIDVILNELLP